VNITVVFLWLERKPLVYTLFLILVCTIYPKVNRLMRNSKIGIPIVSLQAIVHFLYYFADLLKNI